jgi:hypothetical protein
MLCYEFVFASFVGISSASKLKKRSSSCKLEILASADWPTAFRINLIINFIHLYTNENDDECDLVE